MRDGEERTREGREGLVVELSADNRTRDPMRAARGIAAIVKSELNITVDPEALLAMFKKRWRSLNELSHSIHAAFADTPPQHGTHS